MRIMDAEPMQSYDVGGSIRSVVSALCKIISKSYDKRIIRLNTQIDSKLRSKIEQKKAAHDLQKLYKDLQENGRVRPTQKGGKGLGLVWKIAKAELNQQNRNGGNVNESEKRRIQFIISGGDPAKPFEFLEETFNQMPFFV